MRAPLGILVFGDLCYVFPSVPITADSFVHDDHRYHPTSIDESRYTHSDGRSVVALRIFLFNPLTSSFSCFLVVVVSQSSTNKDFSSFISIYV